MCLHTWNFGKTSYDFIIYGNGNKLEIDWMDCSRCWTWMSISIYGVIWSRDMDVQYAIPSATSLDTQMRTYSTIGDDKSYRSHLRTICDPIQCTILLAHRYGHIALGNHQIFSPSQTKTSHQQVTEETITSLYGVVTVN